ncbi:MAG: ABC-F family ATP-binding cassette domain-containing protein, partial [Stellaceae bacterium]
FRAKATKARQAQSRLKMLSKMAPVAVIADDPEMRFDFPPPAESRPPLITYDHVAVGYEPGKPVLWGIDLRLDPDDRIAILGANGNGKSTLAKLLAGRLAPETGHQHRAPKLGIGYFAQHQIEDMVPDETPYDHLAHLMPRAAPEAVRARLGRFGFGQEKAFVPVKDLSGGERARLNFALITYNAPALLILDEPTNHLDIDSREALAVAINDFAGGVVLISHDWHLLELTADRLWLVAGGRVLPFEGDLEAYREAMLGARKAPTSRAKPKSAASASVDRKRLEALRRAARAAEAQIKALTAEQQVIEQRLVRADLPAAERTQLMQRHGELGPLLGKAEKDWLAAAEAEEAARLESRAAVG